MKPRRPNISPPTKHNLLIFACSVASVLTALLLWFYATGGAIAYTMDSLTYRDAALNLLDGRPWMATNVISESPTYLPMVVWPPGYSSLWAFASYALNISIDQVPRVLVPTLLGITTLCIFYIAMMMTGRPAIAGAVATLNAFTPTSMAVFGHAWSETLAIPLSLLSFAAIWTYSESPTSRAQIKWLSISALLIAMSNWTRYSAVVLLPLAFFTVLVITRLPMARKLFHASFVIVLTLVCIAPLWIRNIQLTGSISGSNRGGAPHDVIDRFVDDTHSIFQLFELAVFNFDVVLRANLEVPLILLFFFLLARAVKVKGPHIFEDSNLWIPLMWTGGSLSFLLLARSLQTQLDLDYRMLATATPFAVLVLAWPMQSSAPVSANKLKALILAVGIGLMANTGVSEAQRVHKNRVAGKAPNWRANFAVVYRDLTDSSKSTRAIRAALKGIPTGSLVLTDYRALYIRYLSGANAFQVDGLEKCSAWVSKNKAGTLMTGFSDPMFEQLPLTKWAEQCQLLNPSWKIIQIKGQGSHSMMVDE